MSKKQYDIERKHPFDVIIGQNQISDFEKLLLYKLNNLDNEKGCTMQDKTLAKYFGKRTKSVNRNLKNLENMGYITRTTSETNKRVIRVISLQGNRAVNRVHQKGNPEVTPQSTRELPVGNPTVNLKTEEKTKEKTKYLNTTAFDFLKNEFPIELEQTLIGFRSQIRDWEKFVSFFNNSCDEKNIPYSRRPLFGRLRNLKDRWIENQSDSIEEERRPLIMKMHRA